MIERPSNIMRRTKLGADLNVMTSLQFNKYCRDFELRYRECTASYGLYRYEEKCRLYYEDMMECIVNSKQLYRAGLLNAEFMKQVKEGKAEYMPYSRRDVF